VPRGVGLVGVRERVARVGGTINLESVVGSGTRLTAELPVTAIGATPEDAERTALSATGVMAG
jgi:signal transduction histidine kinase